MGSGNSILLFLCEVAGGSIAAGRVTYGHRPSKPDRQGPETRVNAKIGSTDLADPEVHARGDRCPRSDPNEALGHADWAVTARHYARWIPGGDDEPLRREAGEVYPDLLARLAPFSAESDATRRDGTTFPRDLEASLGTRPPGPRAPSGLRARDART